MNSKNDVIHILGTLMKEPSILSKTDKYQLSIADFPTRFEKYIFDAIQTLYYNGAQRITAMEIKNYLDTNEAAAIVFKKNNGFEYLEVAEDKTNDENFDYYYNHLKKINSLKELNKIGFNTEQFYKEDDGFNIETLELNKKFEKLDITDIFNTVKKDLFKVERNFLKNDVSETKKSFDDISTFLTNMKENADVGLPLQGEIFTEVLSGARKGTLCIRSGSSGLGKSRGMVGDACYLAFPMRFDTKTWSWIQEGSCEKVLYIVTEQTFPEIQSMILAYLTGFNEKKFRYNDLSPMENEVVEQALKVWEAFQDNLLITRMPNPTNELIKQTVRENVILYGVEYVFYDYIFVGPAVLNEFRGANLRNDEVLLILSTTLKDLAAELDVFVMTATQVNANADDNKNIRNEASLAGGRATINKADYGFIMARPTKEELGLLEQFITKYGVEPNLVTDVFKVRAGDLTQTRIWSVFDGGNLRKRDLFITDSRLEQVDTGYDFKVNYCPFDKETEEYINKLLKELN